MEASNDEKLRKEILEIYTPLSVAKEEIWRRWNDKKLRKKVEKFLVGNIPDFIKDKPRGLLVRQITSPDREFFYFLELSKIAKLEPLFVEFGEDKFTSCNPSKYYRCNMYFQNGTDNKNQAILESKKIVDVDKFDGKKIKEVRTFWNEPILSFHHKLIKKICPEYIKSIVDVSKWTRNNGKFAKNYYLKYLAWFICNGILFENFFLKGEEGMFTKKFVLANIKILEKEFGFKPLIVPVAPIEDEDNFYWCSYKQNIKKIIEKMKINI